ncbi:unnamed protein product [Porites lobata]|uniref:GPR180-like N-terminal domain-containing protein n=1 Tax=Porites lobata TaxID=104759 RepID=A0ABN8NFN4_9CNID|nr:unnamed protein product [Porites lobata]
MLLAWKHVVFLSVIALKASSSFVSEGHLKLYGYNFAFLASFCGNASGPVVQYKLSYPQEYCCYKLLSYFQDQWWRIWPRPEVECQDKVRILEDHHSQVLNLTTNSSQGDCRMVVSENGSNILCQGTQMYQVQTSDYLTKKCWFLALSNCNSTGNSLFEGIQMDYFLNITEASPNEAPIGHERNLLSVALAFMVIVFVR